MSMKWITLQPTIRQSLKEVHPRVSHLRSISQLPLSPNPLWSIETCPSPTCACTATPENLDIDHEQPLAGKIPLYDQHVVLCTGKTDWASRIEDDEGGNLVKGLKHFVVTKPSQPVHSLALEFRHDIVKAVVADRHIPRARLYWSQILHWLPLLFQSPLQSSPRLLIFYRASTTLRISTTMKLAMNP